MSLFITADSMLFGICKWNRVIKIAKKLELINIQKIPDSIFVSVTRKKKKKNYPDHRSEDSIITNTWNIMWINLRQETTFNTIALHQRTSQSYDFYGIIIDSNLTLHIMTYFYFILFLCTSCSKCLSLMIPLALTTDLLVPCTHALSPTHHIQAMQVPIYLAKSVNVWLYFTNADPQLCRPWWKFWGLTHIMKELN
jgi:hypothetical protein